MNKLPTRVKALAAIVLSAALYGGAQVLLNLDKTASGKVGLD